MASADTRARLVRTAHELFYRQGFLSVGLDRILHDVGVTKTTFYNHFQSKDDLIVAVLEHHDQWWQKTFCDMLRKRGDAIGSLRRPNTVEPIGSGERIGRDQIGRHQRRRVVRECNPRVFREAIGVLHRVSPACLS